MPELEQTLRIVHNESLPPLVEGREGKSVGLAIDLVQAAGDRSAIKTRFISAAIDQQIFKITSGEADAVLSASTPERRESFDFSDPVVMTGGALYVLSPLSTPDTLQSLAGRTVVTPRTGPLANHIRSAAPEIKLALARDYEEALQLVIDGQAHAAALNFLAGSRIANRLFPARFTSPNKMFYEQPFAIGVPKNQNPTIVSLLNSGLAAIRADGTWQRIVADWTRSTSKEDCR